MLMFTIITLLCVAGVFFRQTYLRSVAAAAVEGRSSRAFDLASYWTWLRRSAKGALRPESVKKSWSIYRDWTQRRYLGWTKWIFAGLTISLTYLAGSGFFFGIFFRRGMFGIFLLGHVILGGLFAISLAAVMLLRARDYRLNEEESAAYEAIARLIFKNLSKPFVRKALFWEICALGLVQITTILGSMVPFFTFRAQQAMITIHRYSALAILLAAVVFIDITFVPQRTGESDLSGSADINPLDSPG